jgi:hypothetical protein
VILVDLRGLLRLRIAPGNYTLQSFRDLLVKSADACEKLKVLYLLTSSREWGEEDKPYSLQGMLRKHEFQLKKLGELKELATAYEDPETRQLVPVEYIAHLDGERQILTCFTQATSEQIRYTIEPLSGEIGIYHLWISPIEFDRMKNEILSEHEYTKIKAFYADRHPAVGFPAKFRAEFRRGFTYRGDDGKETLEELRYYYGVLPRYIDFSIPGVIDFRVHNRGVFHYIGGDLERMFDYSERAVDLMLQVRRILEHSKLEIVPLLTEKKELKIPHVVPWGINFKRTMDVHDAELLVEQLESTKFSVYDTVITEGSVRLDATVLDEQKNSVFMISSDEHQMVVSPRYQTTFDSFLRFYETIAENFDPDATCVTPV